MRNYNLPIILEKDKEGYFVFCPALQGCYSQGETYEEAVVNIRDAIRLHLADRRASRQALPQKTNVSLSAVEVSL